MHSAEEDLVPSGAFEAFIRAKDEEPFEALNGDGAAMPSSSKGLRPCTGGLLRRAIDRLTTFWMAFLLSLGSRWGQ